MKNNLKNILLYFLTVTFFISCSKEDRYEGTPVSNNQDVETIKGIVVSNTLFALPGQNVDFTVTLPSEFIARVNQDIKVEVQTSTTGNSLRTATVDLLKGQTTTTGKVLVGGGGGTFFMPVRLKLNAVKLTSEIVGKHFLLTSDDVSINSGATSVPVDNDKRLQIKIGWESQSTGNVLDCKISRVGSVALTLKGSVISSNNIKINNINYPISYVTNLNDAASNFVLTQEAIIKTNNPGIFSSIKSFGKSIIFNYISSMPTYSITSVAPSSSNIGGSFFTFKTFDSGSNVFEPKEYPVLNTQLSSTTNSGVEGTAVFNEGNYQISISPNVLETSPLNLKYRIIIKKPNGTVLIYSDTYNNATTTSGYKNVLSFTKTGYGDSADYTNFIFTP